VDRKIKQVLFGIGTSVWGGDKRKRCRRVNMLELLCIVYSYCAYENGKKRAVEIVQGMGE
jgi:hypothetical protein